MIFVSICVGSSCFLKGAGKLIELFQNKIEREKLEGEIILSGRFCTEKCNRVGVTISVGDGVNEELITGITPEVFEAFWKNTIEPKLGGR